MTTSTRSMIAFLQEFLTNLRFQILFAPISENQTFENLMVYLGQSPTDQAWFARVLYLTDVQRSLGQPVPPELELLEVYLPLQIQAETPQLSALATLLGKLNAILPAGHFGYRQSDGVYLRHSFVLAAQDEVWPFAVSETLDIFSLHATVLSQVIADTAAGALSVDQAIRRAEQALGTPTAEIDWSPYWVSEN